MIYTLTFCPSLDYVVFLPRLALGDVNRAEKEMIYPGGKGINVSIMLSRLGYESVMLGYVAGFTGAALEKMLEDLGCRADFIHLPQGDTRINVKLKGEEETDINGRGPALQASDLEELYSKLEKLEQGDLLVLAGNVAPCAQNVSYGKIVKTLSGKGVECVVDAAGSLLLDALPHRPFLIKPNRRELGELFHTTLESREDILSCGKNAQALGARNVLVSMAAQGAILLTEDGQLLESPPPAGKAVNSVGAGDSMVAGYLAGWLDTGNHREAFRLALATGSATACHPWLAERRDIEGLLGDFTPTFRP